MDEYIFTSRNGVHIIDLVQTARLLEDAYQYVRKSARKRQELFCLLEPSAKRRASWPKKRVAVALTT